MPLFVAVLAAMPCVGLSDVATKKPTAKVEVVFEKPDTFADVKDSTMGSERDRTAILGMMEEFLVETAPRTLASDQTLVVTITNVDMAGEFEPWHGPQFDNVRIVKDIYPPRISLSFKLTDAAGVVVKEGKRELRDMSFMLTSSPFFAQDSLRYEKSMLNDWLRMDFPKQKTKK